MADLLVLVADRNAEYIVHGALTRPEAIGIRPITYKVISHPDHDGGARTGGVQLLGIQRRTYTRGLLMFDYEGSGAAVDAEELERQLDESLAALWGDSGKAIVIAPEVDVWLWGAETHLRAILDWNADQGIRDWLVTEGFVFDTNGKPHRPKEAFERACRHARRARSSGHYRAIAERSSLQRCEDPAFNRLRAVLQRWFPEVF